MFILNGSFGLPLGLDPASLAFVGSLDLLCSFVFPDSLGFAGDSLLSGLFSLLCGGLGLLLGGDLLPPLSLDEDRALSVLPGLSGLPGGLSGLPGALSGLPGALSGLPGGLSGLGAGARSLLGAGGLSGLAAPGGLSGLGAADGLLSGFLSLASGSILGTNRGLPLGLVGDFDSGGLGAAPASRFWSGAVFLVTGTTGSFGCASAVLLLGIPSGVDDLEREEERLEAELE